MKKQLLLLATLCLLPLLSVNAQEKDDFGVWGTFEATKKINKKLKLDFEVELRTTDGFGDIERASAGVGATYKFTKWLRASAGYIFMYNQYLDEKNIKEIAVDDNDAFLGYNYNIDHAYWTERHRFHITVAGEWKIGRVEFTLRERLQYTRTNSAYTDETKYRWEATDFDENGNLLWEFTDKTEPEYKEPKNNLTLRSRLNAKWDIPKCKFTPFASAELYTRFDKWKGCDKMRYRIGTNYSINKDNSVSLYYLFEHSTDSSEANTHAIGIGYSLDL